MSPASRPPPPLTRCWTRQRVVGDQVLEALEQAVATHRQRERHARDEHRGAGDQRDAELSPEQVVDHLERVVPRLVRRLEHGDRAADRGRVDLPGHGLDQDPVRPGGRLQHGGLRADRGGGREERGLQQVPVAERPAAEPGHVPHPVARGVVGVGERPHRVVRRLEAVRAAADLQDRGRVVAHAALARSMPGRSRLGRSQAREVDGEPVLVPGRRRHEPVEQVVERVDQPADQARDPVPGRRDQRHHPVLDRRDQPLDPVDRVRVVVEGVRGVVVQPGGPPQLADPVARQAAHGVGGEPLPRHRVRAGQQGVGLPADVVGLAAQAAGQAADRFGVPVHVRPPER